MDRPFNHPNLGKEVRVEQFGREIRLTFVCANQMKSDALFRDIARQLKAGALNLSMLGKPIKVEESR